MKLTQDFMGNWLFASSGHFRNCSFGITPEPSGSCLFQTYSDISDRGLEHDCI